MFFSTAAVVCALSLISSTHALALVDRQSDCGFVCPEVDTDGNGLSSFVQLGGTSFTCTFSGAFESPCAYDSVSVTLLTGWPAYRPSSYSPLAHWSETTRTVVAHNRQFPSALLVVAGTTTTIATVLPTGNPPPPGPNPHGRSPPNPGRSLHTLGPSLVRAPLHGPPSPSRQRSSRATTRVLRRTWPRTALPTRQFAASISSAATQLRHASLADSANIAP